MIEPATFCPGCGCNLAAEQPVELGALRVDPRGDVTWAGNLVDLTGGQHQVLSTLAQARGQLVTKAVLEERLGYEGLANVVDVHLVRIRRKLRQAGAPATAIATVTGRGHRLNLEALQCR